MRRATRSVEKVLDSELFPDPESSVEIQAPAAFERASWMPEFHFVQSSPHTSVASVNGETETVHWVVKDRPFSIRVLEVPSAPSEDMSETNLDESSFASELAWSDVVVEADVVYTKNHLPVKLSTGHSPLGLGHQLIPPHIYSHRRNANHFDTGTVPAEGSACVLKLKEGAGLELLVRLSLLSSHLRNDFCLHLKLYLRQQLVASWYSQTIRSVSKWDKVRHLQDSSSSSSSSSTKANSHSHRSTSSYTPSHAHTVRSALSQVAQKPVSASLSKIDANADNFGKSDMTDLAEADDATSDLSSSPPPLAARASSSSASRASAHHSQKNTKKKKASGEEVFEMLDQLNSNLSELQRLHHSSSTSSKKRKASWNPSVTGYPTEIEAEHQAQVELAKRPSSTSRAASTSVANFKKFKRSESLFSTSPHVLSEEVEAPSATTGAEAALNLQKHANEFLSLIDTMAPSEVRSALNSVLLMRPNLYESLCRLMKYEGVSNLPSMSSSTHAPSISQPIAVPELASATQSPAKCSIAEFTNGWSSTELPMPCLTASGNVLSHSAMWSDERYGLGPQMSESHFGLEAASADYYDMPSLSPSGLDEDSTTIGSPSTSYTSWDDWQPKNESTPFLGSSNPHAMQLTDSSLFPVHMENSGI